MAGVWYAVFAYVFWGLFPLYWKHLDHVPAMQLLGHRIVWSFLLLLCVVAAGARARRVNPFGRGRLTPRALRIYALAAVLIGVNWFTFVWAVNSKFVVETSLGYFITPLVNVVFGVLVLRERLRPLQWGAVGLAASGVLYLTIVYGALPWIALVLAISFGSYGLVKKRAPFDAVDGLTLETGMLLIPAIAYLLYIERAGQGAFRHTGGLTDALLAGAGPLTTIPLLFFAAAVRRIPLSLLGLLQFIAPTLQFFLGVWLYREPFARTQLVGFGMVWAALALFGVESLVAHRRSLVAAPS